jgi:c-di-GMP phosphodiesterase
MKIHHFVITSGVLFLLIVGTLSQVFYTFERKAVLGYLISGITQSVFRLEGDIRTALEAQEQEYRIQSILDRASAIDFAIDELAISLDGKKINYSSQRSQIDKQISKKYKLFEEINKEISSDDSTRYVSTFEYFDGERAHNAQLFIEIDHQYVYDQLERLAWMFGVGLFILMIGISLLALFSVRRLFLYPLRKLAVMVKTKDERKESYFINEFSDLSQTIASTFHELNEQNEKLQESLSESRYLDRILRTVTDLNSYLISSSNAYELSQKCCERLSEHKEYGICWIGLVDDDKMEVVGCAGDSGLLYRGLKINLSHPEDMFSYAPSIQAFSENDIVSMDHLELNESLATWSFIAREEHDGSFIALPLRGRSGEEPFGVLSLYGRHSDGFLQNEMKMLEQLAGDIGFAIHAYVQREQFTQHLQVDVVTGLANRMSLIDALTYHDTHALAIINIDRFSDLNDVYGVGIGDQVLAGYGHWLTKRIENAPGTSLYKLGSDEYALLFDRKEDPEGNISFLEYLIEKTAEESFIVEGIEVILTISVGFDPISDKVLENATRALKEAKLQHKSLLVYTPVMGAKKEQEKNIEWYKEIKEALQEDRIVPYYQAIVDTKTHKIVKYEALIRLIKADGTVVSPFHFLEIAQKIRLYPSLTKIMIDKVLERFEGLGVKVSINLSNEDILNSELADYIEEAIVRRKIGQFLIFEILETEGITSYGEVSRFVERFRNLGCSFAIDDFGSGYSNFDHILKLNIDTLKIDASLIKNLPHDHNSQIIVRHICEFATEMGLSTIAEFVASEEIYHKVLELGIDMCQGYYFNEPSETLHG